MIWQSRAAPSPQAVPWLLSALCSLPTPQLQRAADEKAKAEKAEKAEAEEAAAAAALAELEAAAVRAAFS